MKKIILNCLLLSVNVTVFSQIVTSAGSIIQTDYLKKSKNQKTAAWILLGGGTTLTIIGGVLAFHDFGEELGNIFNPNPQPAHNNGPAASILLVTGAVSMLGSIPLFISASKNKHKALSMTFKNDFVPELKNSTITKVPVPGVSLLVSF